MCVCVYVFVVADLRRVSFFDYFDDVYFMNVLIILSVRVVLIVVLIIAYCVCFLDSRAAIIF